MRMRMAVAGMWFVASLVNGRFAVFTQLESWSGLAGVVNVEGKQVELPALVWSIAPVEKPQGSPRFPDTLEPQAAKKYPAVRKYGLAPGKTEKLDFSQPVTVRVRGEKIEFTRAPRNTRTVASDFDDLYLGYPSSELAKQLVLFKKPSEQTEWLVVAAEREVSRKKHGVDGFQFEIRQVVRFRLEAKNRPGWFLTVNDADQLCLDNNLPDDEMIQLEYEVFYDDLSDGK